MTDASKQRKNFLKFAETNIFKSPKDLNTEFLKSRISKKETIRLFKSDKKAGKIKSKETEKVKSEFKQKENVTVMSNAFLPFIVESSSLENIFNSLLTRSKGVPVHELVSLIVITLEHGVKKIRAYADSLPAMSTSKLYSEIVDNFEISKPIDLNDLNLILSLEEYVSLSKIKFKTPSTADWKKSDFLLFYYIAALTNKLDQNCDYPWKDIINEYTDVLKDIRKYVEFSNSGEVKYFKNESSLKAFIVYCAFINKNAGVKPIKAIIDTEV